MGFAPQRDQKTIDGHLLFPSRTIVENTLMDAKKITGYKTRYGLVVSLKNPQVSLMYCMNTVHIN